MSLELEFIEGESTFDLDFDSKKTYITVLDSSVNKFFAKTLEEVDCDEATSINAYSFVENSGIKKVRFSNVTTIGTNNFRSCPNLEIIDLPNLTGNAGAYFCTSCGKLTSINIPKVARLSRVLATMMRTHRAQQQRLTKF